MKKAVAFAVSFLFHLSFSFAFADTVNIDTETASIEQLLEAHSTISNAILQKEEKPAIDDSFVISGSGTQILDGFSLDSYLSRFVVTCNDAIKVTYYTENDSRTYDDSRHYGCFGTYIVAPDPFTSIMVESAGEWTIDMSPIARMAGSFASGIGPYITDCFITTPPKIVTIKCSGHKYGAYLQVTLYKITNDGRILSETAIDYGNVYVLDEPVEYDVIIKPEEDIWAYFWKVDCAVDAEWSISEK